MIAAGVSAKMLRQLQQLGGSAGRLGELLYVLKDVENNREESDGEAVREGDTISFENVEVRTPTGLYLHFFICLQQNLHLYSCAC